jgi:flagellar protein FliO/FliZ
MFEYILRLFILVPMIGGLAWGSLWLWRKAQMGLPVNGSAIRAAQMVDVLPLGPGSKLAVVAFGGRELLIAVSRTQITLIAEDARENAGA